MQQQLFSAKSLAWRAVLSGLCIMMAVLSSGGALAQSDLDDSSSDPMKLFERGQNAHARGDLEKALEFYAEALKVRPEFPEAEFQRGSALASLKRFDEAEMALRRAVELRVNWALPRASLGIVLLRLNREREAEEVLRQTLKLDPENDVALRVLGDIRLRAGDFREALELARKATTRKDAPASVWVLRAMAERAAGAKSEAATSLDRALELEPENVAALVERAELRIDSKDLDSAIKDLREAERLSPNNKNIASRLAFAYEQNGQSDQARRIAEAAGLIASPTTEHGAKVIGSDEEIAQANSEDPLIARKALLVLLGKNPRSATLLARLGESYRTEDPAKSLDYYRQASELEPTNHNYVVGYAAALVQERRFADAINLLERVLAKDPNHYAAHANLATALYAQKNYPAALSEYDWLIKNKPDLVVAYYFIATAHDNLGEYPEALAAYEAFIARANEQSNRLEIEKVKLRLPILKRQIQLGQGNKRKPSTR